MRRSPTPKQPKRRSTTLSRTFLHEEPSVFVQAELKFIRSHCGKDEAMSQRSG
jgi:hypothetical protein